MGHDMFGQYEVIIDGPFITAISVVVLSLIGYFAKRNVKEHGKTTDAVTGGFDEVKTKLDGLSAHVHTLASSHATVARKVDKLDEDQQTLLTWMVSQDDRMDKGGIPPAKAATATKAANSSRTRRKVSVETTVSA